MAINLTEAQVAELVAKVVREIRSEAPAAGHTWDATQYDGRKFVGVFDTMEEAIAAAEAGYKTIRATSVADREKLISSIRAYCRAEAATMAALGVAETKMGKVEHPSRGQDPRHRGYRRRGEDRRSRSDADRACALRCGGSHYSLYQPLRDCYLQQHGHDRRR